MIEKNVFVVLKYRCRQPVRASSKTNKTVTLLDEKGVIPAKQVLNVGTGISLQLSRARRGATFAMRVNNPSPALRRDSIAITPRSTSGSELVSVQLPVFQSGARKSAISHG
jgi:hypothetical protein